MRLERARELLLCLHASLKCQLVHLVSRGDTDPSLQRNMETKGLITAGGCETLLTFIVLCSQMHSFLIHTCKCK